MEGGGTLGGRKIGTPVGGGRDNTREENQDTKRREVGRDLGHQEGGELRYQKEGGGAGQQEGNRDRRRRESGHKWIEAGH